MSKKLLFLTARLPYPPISGRKNVMYYYCKYLHEMYGYEIVNVSFLEDGDEVAIKPEFINKIYKLKNPSGKAKIKNLILNTIIKQKYPIQVSLFYDKKIQSIIQNIIEDENPDIVMCDMIRTSEYLKHVKLLKILDMDDMISIRYERQMKSSSEDINPFGAYLYRLPEMLQKVLLRRQVKNYVMNKEIKLLKQYEKSISHFYDAIVFVAQKEADTLNKSIGELKALAVPLGVDAEYFEKMINNEKLKNSISFLGVMNVAHNEAAAIHFCNNILPLIKTKIPDVRFFIVGGGATEKIRNLASDNVIVTGRVEDVRDYISRTQVFVSPLLFGSGIKTKNLEAMAMGVPVVTTSIGAESINAVNNKEWLVRDEDSDFANEVVKLLIDKNYAKKIGVQGYRYVNREFTWKKVMVNWNKVFSFLKINDKVENNVG